MKMTFRRVSRSLPEYRRLKKQYLKAFPSNERAPFFVLMSRKSRKNVDFWAVYADSKWAGLAYVVSRRDISYLFYLVIDEKMRGKGIGTKAVRNIIKLYEGQKLFLALEPWEDSAENTEQRLKRRDFYSRCGLSPIDFHIIEGDVVYNVMSAGGNIKPFEYGMMMHYFLGFPINRLVRTRMIKKGNINNEI